MADEDYQPDMTPTFNPDLPPVFDTSDEDQDPDPSNDEQNLDEPQRENEQQRVGEQNEHVDDRSFRSLKEITAYFREAGLGLYRVIFAFDFSKSSGRAGHVPSARILMHEKVTNIIGETLAPSDDEKSVRCIGLGFGDVTTRDKQVFCFQSDCRGYKELLASYTDIVPNVMLSEPTSLAPVIVSAIDFVKESGGQYHVLVIIANGEVTRSAEMDYEELSPQELDTIRSIEIASSFPLSIVLVGVGDGEWEYTMKFISKIPIGASDKLKFISYTHVKSEASESEASESEMETKFAFSALDGIPSQYKAAIESGMIECVMGRAQEIVLLPPVAESSHAPRDPVCQICQDREWDTVFSSCGHKVCETCVLQLEICPWCRMPIDQSFKVYP